MHGITSLAGLITFGIALSCAQPAGTAQEAHTPIAPIELTLRSRDATLAATLQFPDTGRAPFPAIALAHGSGRVTRAQMEFLANRFLGMGVAVLIYDKRGVGQSTGEYVNVGTARSVEVFGLLADDALAGVAARAGRPITVVTLPGADHSLRNPVTGERPDFWPQVRAWLARPRARPAFPRYALSMLTVSSTRESPTGWP